MSSFHNNLFPIGDIETCRECDSRFISHNSFRHDLSGNVVDGNSGWRGNAHLYGSADSPNAGIIGSFGCRNAT